jgi:phosphatidylglycerophosphate synthase
MVGSDRQEPPADREQRMSNISGAALDDQINEQQQAKRARDDQRSGHRPATQISANSDGHSSFYHQAAGAAISSAPNLILIAPRSPRSPDLQLHDADLNLLGLGLLQRTVLAAQRAAYGKIMLLGQTPAAPSGLIIARNWSSVAAALQLQTAPLVIAPATILGETDWCEKLVRMQIDASAWASIPDHLIVLRATAVPDALAALQEGGGAADVGAVQDRLTRRFGPAAALAAEINPVVISTPKDISDAERRLLRSLVKKTDGFMARHVDRHISLQISRRLARTAVTPTQITFLSIGIGFASAPFFLSSHWYWQTPGALLFLVHSIVDGCDGELARLKFQESRYGGILDFWGDNLVHAAIFACIAVGWALASASLSPLWLGVAAVIGTLASAGFVYWRQMVPQTGTGPLFTSVSSSPDKRLARLLNAAAARDFVYLLPVLAFFGKSSWVLVLAALGAPAFFVTLVSLAIREKAQQGSSQI